jgi:prophage DNA circulation protein
MSWHDRFSARGRFRQAEFVIRTDELQFGRRNQVHEYPDRDDAYVEDLGRRARQFRIEVYVIGPDYDRRRDALIEAVEQPGPGTLVHPYHGTLQVSITDARKSESTERGGVARFSLTCVKDGGARWPTTVTDTPTAVRAQADEARRAVEAEFAHTFGAAGQQEFVRAESESLLARAGDAVAAAVDAIPGMPEPASRLRADLSRFAGAVSSLMLKPKQLASEITGLVADIGAIAKRPGLAASAYAGLDDHGDDAPSVPRTTPARVQQADNQAAVGAIVQRTAVIEAGRASSRMTWPTLEDAVAMRDALADRLDEQSETAGAAVFRALQDLRVAVVHDINTRGADLARLGSYTPRATLPALVIAHRVYGDASSAAELVERNAIPHPGFVAGGEPLEVRVDG